ncbi:MAG: 50S ribosome-binding GTPase, partial [Actinobacteria bacterium]|nr:50S ribosome-binding GTPase [Actinomycetota bacterium]
MDVVCTAGHVDHGKSALVRALTGMEPDRFDEERRRGLTIDIGFAWARLGSPSRTVAFVDLPGHERFVANMLAGAGPVETTLFVVAADEGWMPQSQEHLDILDLLGVRRGVVALTKADTVDADTLEVARELTREALEGSALASADVLAVSARTGAGLSRLTQRLTDLLAAAPAAADRDRPRLWVDRSFTVRGAGTVVTGTLAAGRLCIGDEVSVLPSGGTGRDRGRGPMTGRDRTRGVTSRVRGLQTLQSPVEEVSPGSRVAVNLSGVDRAQVARGDALGLPDQWLAVEVLDASLRALPGQRIGRRGAWHLHAGSGQRLARVLPLAGRPVTTEGFVRVELEKPMALTAGDRVVLREAG